MPTTNAQQFEADIKAAKNGDTVKLNGNIVKDVLISKLVNLDLNGKTITGNVTIKGAAKQTISLTNGKIVGNLTVDTPQATINNGLTVTGNTVINNVAYGTWNEKANGNKLVVNDPDGIKLTVAPGNTVAAITVAAQAVGNVTITNNGTIEKVDAQASVELVNNPGAKTELVTGTADVTVSGNVENNTNEKDPNYSVVVAQAKKVINGTVNLKKGNQASDADKLAEVKTYIEALVDPTSDVSIDAKLIGTGKYEVTFTKANAKFSKTIEVTFDITQAEKNYNNAKNKVDALVEVSDMDLKVEANLIAAEKAYNEANKALEAIEKNSDTEGLFNETVYREDIVKNARAAFEVKAVIDSINALDFTKASYVNDVAASESLYDDLSEEIKVDVTNYEDLLDAKAGIVIDEDSLNFAIQNASKIFLTKSIELKEFLLIDKKVQINGNSKTLKGPQSITGVAHNSTVVIQADNVEISNLTVNANSVSTGVWVSPARFALQVYDVTGVKLTNVSLGDGQAGLLVNAKTANADVIAEKLYTTNNGFGGIEVFAADGKTSTLTISNSTHTDATDKPAIWDEGAGTKNVVSSEYTKVEQDNGQNYYTKNN